MVGFFTAIVCAVAVLGSAFANEIETSGVQPLHIQWAVDVDQRMPNSPSALSVPAVVHHDGESLIVVGGRDKWVHVYDLQGSDIRRIRIDEATDSGALALRNGLVVLADTAGRLYGIDPAKGEIVWRFELTAGLTSIPVALGDDFLVQTTDNRIYRFSPSGKKQWSYAGRNNTLSMYLMASPLVANGHVYALLSNGDGVALRADNGDVIWKKQLLLSNESAALSDLKAPLATPLFVSRLSMDGEKVENALLMPFFQGDLLVVSEKNGTQHLSLPVSLKSTPLLMGSMLYMADSSGFLYMYDLEKGKRLWRKKIAGGALLGPVLWKGSIWLLASKGVMYQVNLKGELQASVLLGGHISRLPVLTEKGLLVRTDRGMMYMVKP